MPGVVTAMNTHDTYNNSAVYPFSETGMYCDCSEWLGWAMVLGSFQCRGVLLLLHILGQGPAMPAAGAGRVGYIFLYFSSIFLFLCPVVSETAELD